MGSGGRRTARQPTEGVDVRDPVILEVRYRPVEDDAASTTEPPDQEYISRAELARQLNASIYKAGRSLADLKDEDFELTFFCACGCMAEIRRSLRDYASAGAVLEGHSRPGTV
jgi:hypothetical protein